ncbi:MAG: arginine--tRNA ligase [Candidatus Yanofskybacteria bacterium CG10_big_fil_rev_8_21_14_0_10_36_16]|uniref:Arginine--tRNA ligase n=1 Tax=Candidatus Yanofskybacteria bacterium CG10_big_fil_rev_8_21_14_0_10_36_16 TaxID=1975096 RepID=A0A2J0Q7Y0_9BACT|nr:MAG: arginine--tRNA ligase [Candidatus Yanofskybacteria bacterium CG10_big_fil_rev_8_21_14_0_10_36_16]
MTKATLHEIIEKITNISNFDISYPLEDRGDLACNVSFVVAKQNNSNPKDEAELIIKKLKDDGDIKKAFSKIEFAAPGFINFYYSKNVLLKNAKEILKQKEEFGRGDDKKDKILIEYFQPNIAKPIHLGHLRTAIIGDALYRILKFSGYNIESDSHIGDWGTQFGLLLYAYKNFGDEKVVEENPIEELNKLYIDINEKAKHDPDIREKGKAEFAALEKGDEENKKLWEKFAKLSWQEFEKTYELLNIRKSDHNWPESFYEDKMPAVLDELEEKGLLKESEGAKIVDLEEYGLGVALLVKSDGATMYLLRDIAGFIFKKKQGFSRQLFVVDNRQEHIFRQLFKVLDLMGHIKSNGEGEHISYGILKLAEGAMSTRKGTDVSPEVLMDKANELALKIIEEKNQDLENKEQVAKKVAIGAVKYFDLSHNRHSDIVFEWDKVLNFEGNTGPYLQYTHARIKSILRKADNSSNELSDDSDFVDSVGDEEKPLLRYLVRFPEVVSDVAKNHYPNQLCEYLYNLASKFNSFYEAAPVLNEPDETKRALRLGLIMAVSQIIKNGLGLLGIEAPEEM